MRVNIFKHEKYGLKLLKTIEDDFSCNIYQDYSLTYNPLRVQAIHIATDNILNVYLVEKETEFEKYVNSIISDCEAAVIKIENEHLAKDEHAFAGMNIVP